MLTAGDRPARPGDRLGAVDVLSIRKWFAQAPAPATITSVAYSLSVLQTAKAPDPSGVSSLPSGYLSMGSLESNRVTTPSGSASHIPNSPGNRSPGTAKTNQSQPASQTASPILISALASIGMSVNQFWTIKQAEIKASTNADSAPEDIIEIWCGEQVNISKCVVS
ncbi:unnamed protein product [Protopolystoma xenopodis]|uniref:Uncharacterized protein n=1 Tax=Protopolystoma xenopodis TaxID=117903 RepID=A0A448WFT6_9PLAT|nr:unnamed protein product [Protopolystoma xenopodis]